MQRHALWIAVMNRRQQLTAQLQPLLDALGLEHWGLAALDRPLSFAWYRSWLDAGLHGDMHYLVEHAPIKELPQRKWPRAQTALVFAIPYYPHPAPQPTPLKQARVSLYAQGADYHFWFRERLQQICTHLQQAFPEHEFLAFTDSSPVLERDLARKAGLGWAGKNTCLIHPQKGSLFFLGEIYCSLPLEEEHDMARSDTEPQTVSGARPAFMSDHCGSCTRCLDICPTDAFIAPRVLDARKCISYLNIESRQVPDENLRAGIGDWLFGCDLCQTVCPFNQKRFAEQLDTSLQQALDAVQAEALIADLRYLLTASGKRIDKDFRGTPMARAGGFGLKRNALIVAGNRRLHALHNEIAALTDHERLGELAQWALRQLDAPVESLPAQ